MRKLKRLPQEVVRAIAAGEVVESPASVVKELLENSLDAGAEKIDIFVEGSGLNLIRVVDDGEGIPREDLPHVLERHTTSKIEDLDDLYRIFTFGFRGEALHAIGAVSKLRIRTRYEGEEGSLLEAEGGKVTLLRPDPWVRGTSVEVGDLFYNVPARKKFVHSHRKEKSKIIEVVRRITLPVSNVDVSLFTDGKEVLRFYRSSPLEDRFLSATGISAVLVKVKYSLEGVEVSGVMTPPESFVHSRRWLYIYVNGRWTWDETVFAAIMAVTSRFADSGRYPAGVLQIQLPPEDVDVNVHPRKERVKFRNPSRVFDAVKGAIYSLFGGSVPDAVEEVKDRDLSLPAPVSGERSEVLKSTSDVSRVNEAINFYYHGRHKDWKFHGTAFGKFAIVEKEGELILVDVHAMAEAVAYARLMRSVREGERPKFVPLIAETLSFAPHRMGMVHEILPYLRRMGFVIDEAGPGMFTVREVPDILKNVKIGDVLLKVFDEIEGKGKIQDMVSEICASLACHSVVRGMIKLTERDIMKLLEDFFDESLMRYCPHGRPLIMSISKEELEKRFGRR